MAYSECLPTRLNPLVERTCFSQVRVLISKFSPSIPEWTDDARDVLKFRTDQWSAGITAMYALGKTLEEIQVTPTQSDAPGVSILLLAVPEKIRSARQVQMGADKPPKLKPEKKPLAVHGFKLLTKLPKVRTVQTRALAVTVLVNAAQLELHPRTDGTPYPT